MIVVPVVGPVNMCISKKSPEVVKKESVYKLLVNLPIVIHIFHLKTGLFFYPQLRLR